MKKIAFQLLLACFTPFFVFSQISRPCSPGKIIISEIYSDPTPSNGLPEFEYLELFNTCVDTIDLNNWKITDGSATGTISGEKLPPSGYLILCQAKVRQLFEPFGKTVGLTTWPTLNNKTDSLTLLNHRGDIMDVVVYNLDALPEKAKSNGGWSIEITDPWLHCRGFANWGFSVHPLGGTPGIANSIFRRTPDLIQPKIEHVHTPTPNLLVLEFDEPMSMESLINGTYSITENSVAGIDFRPGEKDKVYLTLLNALETGRTYHISLQGVRDCNDNMIDSGPIPFVYDVVPPVLQSIRYNSFYAMECIFDEPLDIISACSTLNYLLEGQHPAQATMTGKNQVSLTFNDKFKIGQEYLLRIANVRDFSGNAITNPIEHSFVFDSAIDSIIVHDPYLISLHFKAVPDVGSLYRENFIVAPYGIPENISFDPVNPERAMLHLTAPLKANSWSTLKISSLVDSQGNLLQTPSQQFYYDTRAPQLAVLTVIDYCRLELVFDERIDLNTAVAVHNFETDHSNIFPANVIAINDSTLQLVFAETFINEKAYTLSIGNIQDIYLNSLSRRINVTFVYDTKPPDIISVKQFQGNKIRLRFSEPPSSECLSASNFEVNHALGAPLNVVVAPWDSSLIWLVYSNHLVEAEDFHVRIENLSDKNGNIADGPVTVQFSTVFPEIAEVEVVSSNEMKVVFSEEINLLIGLNNELYRVNGSSVALSVTAVSKTEVICSFPIDFVHNSINSLRVAQVVDLSGNISENQEIDFVYSKKISKVTALDYHILRIEFTEFLDAASILDGQFIILPSSSGIAPAHYSLDQGNGKAIKLVLGQPLRENEKYEIEISNILDMYGRTLPKEKAEFLIDKTPPRLLGSKTFLPGSIVAIFSEPVEKKTADNRFFYHIPGCGNPIKATLRSGSSNEVLLEFGCDLKKGASYTLKVSGVTDLVGNQMVNQEITLIYSPPYEPSFNDLIITEIMAAPGTNAYFRSEYLEIYNRSADTINLMGIKLADLVKTTSLAEYFLPPGEYVTLVPTKDVPDYAVHGPVLGVSNWPALNDQEDELTLANRMGDIIFSVYYQDSWYRDSSKKKGYSLEMIDTSNPCSGYHNWTASENPKGGTPGQENSVKAENPDLTAPAMVKAIAPDPNSIVLYFNEKMEPLEINHVHWQYEPHVEIASARFDGMNWEKIKKHIQSPLSYGFPYTISVQSLKDCAGNMINPQKRSATFQVCQAAAKNDVLFNEILFNPRTGGVEFIELYNRKDHPIDLKNWLLIVSDKPAIVSTDHLVIGPGDFMVLTRDPEILKADYPKGREEVFFRMKNMQALVNKEGVVVLADSLGMVIDSLYYNEKMHSPMLKNNKGVSLERLSIDLATTDPNNWASAAGTASFATPGNKNSQMKLQVPGGSMFSVSPVTFSPDDHNGRNHTFINYQLDVPGYIATISIFDRLGRLVKELARNESLGSSGAFRWDGLDIHGRRVGVGYYVILIEAFDLEGRLLKVRERVAVGF